MSRAEELCAESLRLVLPLSVEVIRNHRPDFLRNPETGRNLELDFFLPEFLVGLEIQGEHHYSDDAQKSRDAIKLVAAAASNVRIIRLGIFQISPSVIHKKLRQARVRVLPFDRAWLNMQQQRAVGEYRQAIVRTYGRGECHTPPTAHASSARKKAEVAELFVAAESRARIYIQHKGKRLNGIVVDLSPTGKRVLVRAVGVMTDFYVKANRITLRP